MNDKLYELISVTIRQVALIYGTYLISTGNMEKSMLEPVIGLSLNTFSIAWMAYARFIDPAVTIVPVIVPAVTPIVTPAANT